MATLDAMVTVEVSPTVKINLILDIVEEVGRHALAGILPTHYAIYSCTCFLTPQ
jgi:hypothetical protein